MSEVVHLKVKKSLPADVGHGRARIDQKTRDQLGVNTNDIIEIRGTRVTCSSVMRLLPEEEGRGIIRIDGMIRKNAGVSVDDLMEVRKAEVVPAEKVVLGQVIPDSFRNDPSFIAYLKKNLLRRAAVAGDVIALPNTILTSKVLPLRVISTVPEKLVVFTPETEVVLKEKVSEVGVTAISYEDVGGLGDELMRVREMIEFPLKHPELFARMGIDSPKGVLLYGPPGTGKTLIAKAVANESGATFFSIQGPEIMSKFFGESEEQLRKKFELAEEKAPSIIFIDEMDSIAPKREDVHGEVERRVVAQMLTLMDGLRGRGQIIVIGATNRIDAVDPALRRPGRFDREIMIGVPARNGRKEILEIHTRGMPLEEKVKLDDLADLTHGFTGADLAALSREAAMKALRRYIPQIDIDKQIPPEVLETMNVTTDDFQGALMGIEPSALREFFVEVPEVGWDDIGGLDEVIAQLKESVEWPLKQPEAFERLGINAPKGIVLFGPPGTGKTLLAKAVANESEANFIPVNGPSIMSKWVGESEKAIREVFKLAKQSAPSIVLLDELDSIAPMRGSTSSGTGSVTDKIVNQLLTSMDGIEGMKHVVVIATTNRPDLIDPALMRTGRFDRRIMVGLPDEAARRAIIKIHTENMPIKGINVNDIALRTEGMVGSDIEALCREAGMIALRRDKQTKTVTAADFEAALEKIAPSVSELALKFYTQVAEELGDGITRSIKEDVEGYG